MPRQAGKLLETHDSRDLIEKNSPVPYYHQLKLFILNQVESQRWTAGTKLPSEAEFCGFFDISRTVVRQALRELQNDGYLVTRKGKGTFVSGPKITEGLVQNLSGFTEDMVKRGFHVTNVILEQVVVAASESVAQKLEVQPGLPVIKIRRIRNLNHEPAAIVTTYIPQSLCPDLLTEQLSQQSLYILYEHKFGLKIHKARRYISVRLAGKETASLLNVSPDSPVLVLDNVAYLESGRPLEYFQAFHRGDTTQFEIIIHRPTGVPTQ